MGRFVPTANAAKALTQEHYDDGDHSNNRWDIHIAPDSAPRRRTLGMGEELPNNSTQSNGSKGRPNRGWGEVRDSR